MKKSGLHIGHLALCGMVMLIGSSADLSSQQQGTRPAGTHQDMTEGKEWIRRLERPERIPGLKIPEVIAALGLAPGMVVADIGAGTGAFTISLAQAVAPSGKALAVDLHPDLMDYIAAKATHAKVTNLQTVLAERDDPKLPPNQVDVAFFHDVFHNVNDRQDYLRRLVSYLKPGGRIAIVEQEFDDPIAKKWDVDADRITPQQVKTWMSAVGFELQAEFDMFQGSKNPAGTGMPARWFVVYGKKKATSNQP
jgi:predicted methyltransferase